MNPTKTYTFQNIDKDESQILAESSRFLGFHGGNTQALNAEKYFSSLGHSSQLFDGDGSVLEMCLDHHTHGILYLCNLWSLQRALHTSPANKDTLSLILQMRNCDSERLVIKVTKEATI